MNLPCPSQELAPFRLIHLSHLQLSLLWAYESEPPISGRTGHYYNPSLTAWLILRGSVRVKYHQGEMRASSGEWLFPPVGENYREFSPRARLLSICFRANFSPRKELFEEKIPHKCFARRHPQLEAAARPLVAYVSSRYPEARNHMMLRHFSVSEYIEMMHLLSAWMLPYYEVMCSLGAKPSVMKQLEPRVSELKVQLDQMPLCDPLAMEKLARELGLSAAQLTRLFQQSMGMSPVAYFSERKLRHAQNILVETMQPIKQLAFDLGFRDPAHFSNWFLQRTGKSPSNYRAKG